MQGLRHRTGHIAPELQGETAYDPPLHDPAESSVAVVSPTIGPFCGPVIANQGRALACGRVSLVRVTTAGRAHFRWSATTPAGSTAEIV